MFQYRSFSHKTLGASHKKSGIPCQDEARSYCDDKMAIAIVADGHGSPQYFRSDAGSKIAAQAAMDGIKAFIEQTEPKAFEPQNQKQLKQLAKNIIYTWREEIMGDLRDHPLLEDHRISTLEEKYQKRYLNDLECQHISHIYGTTLIAVAVTKDYWFGLHIGDGKCVVLFDNGDWEQPIPWDDVCFLNSTTSICDDDAIEKFRFWCGPTEKDFRKPIALFVNSDGVDDTYPVNENEKHLKNLYRTIVLSFAKDGFESTSQQIAHLAERLAEKGSCDDVSISGIIDLSLTGTSYFLEWLSTQEELDQLSEQVKESRQKSKMKKEELHKLQEKEKPTTDKWKDALSKWQTKKKQWEQQVSWRKQSEQMPWGSKILADIRKSEEQAKKQYVKAFEYYQTACSEYQKIRTSLHDAQTEWNIFHQFLQKQEDDLLILKEKLKKLSLQIHHKS